jgi:hypothetical protein
MKSGFKTSEFATTVAATITYVLVATGVISSDVAGDMGELVLQAVSGIVALGAIVSYALSRTELKKKQLEIDEKIG